MHFRGHILDAPWRTQSAVGLGKTIMDVLPGYVPGSPETEAAITALMQASAAATRRAAERSDPWSDPGPDPWSDPGPDPNGNGGIEDLEAKCECATDAWAFQMAATPSADELGAARAVCMANYRAFIAQMEADDFETDCKVARPIYKKPIFMVGAAVVGGLVIWRLLG